MTPLAKARERARVLWLALLHERASPKQTAIAVAVGVFIGLSPAVGFHGGIAVVAATALRVNRLFSFVGSRVSNPLIGPPLVFAQVELAHRVRTGAWLEMSARSVVEHARELAVDWLLGMLVFGLPLSMALGAVAYAWAAHRRAAAPADAEER